MKNEDKLTTAIRDTLISPNVSDSNFEAANVVDVLDNIARAIWCGTRRTLDEKGINPGAIEFHALQIRESAEEIAQALNNVADAIRELAGKGKIN